MENSTTERRPSLPTGTVAFLFSDVEGSTRRWEAASDAMRDAMRRHDEILRSEIERGHGYVFKTIGDAFCAAFWTAGEALAAAIAVQRRLAREDFAGVGGLTVRISIHAGETDERAGDYFGVAVNRTARLLSAGHGGQIVVSAFAAELARPALPRDVALRNLGLLPLRDLQEPESVFAPIAPGITSEFKPLRALEVPPNNLPHNPTSFIGRHDDVLRIDGLLDQGALVTIAGAGGIGKTRVALAVAASRLTGEPDGAWFVDLSSVSDAGTIAATILSTLGAEAAGGEPRGALIGYLEKRRLLLLLDNSEHLVAEVAALASLIVARCPHVSVLATSRESLDVAGECVYRLASLDRAASVELFADRARAADPAFRSEEKRPIIEAICERLDGIALAVELAAARLRAMSVEDVAARLELRLLAGGRDRRPRQQTMRALIDWSYALLDERERRLLRYCAAFVRGFTAAVAAKVCAQGEDDAAVYDGLASLVDKSLVGAETARTQRRYRLLEPIREYAWDALVKAGEAEDAQRRHAAVFAAVASASYSEWENGPQGDWLARAECDLPNLRRALGWALQEKPDPVLGARIAADAVPTFLRLSLLSEGIEWCERALHAAHGVPRGVEARLRYGLSMLYTNQGQSEKVAGEAIAAAALFRADGDARGLARALAQVATRYASAGRYAEARSAAEEALALASGDRRLQADTLRRCAEAFAPDGDECVRTLFARSVELFRPFGRDDDTGRALLWWGQWEAASGNFGVAAERLLEAKALQTGDVNAMYVANDIAGCYLAIGDRARAAPFAREALILAAKTRHPIIVPSTIAYIAALDVATDVSRAARLIGYAQDRLASAGWQLVPYDRAIVDALLEALRAALSGSDFRRLLDEGASWSDEYAVGNALHPVAS